MSFALGIPFDAFEDAFSVPAAPSPAQQALLDQRASRLAVDKAALVQLDQQISSIDRSIVDLTQQTVRLGEAIQMSRLEREDLVRRRDILRTDVQATQCALCPASLCTDDVLGVIFEHLASGFRRAALPCNHANDIYELGPLHPGPMQQYENQIQASTAVASVCRAWRDVALICPSIWNAIAVRSLDRYAADSALNRQADHIRLLLVRSVQMPLDIFVQTLEHDAAPYTDVMDELYRHMRRWRRFECSSSRGCALPIHKYLRGHAPLLEELRVVQDRGTAPPTAVWSSSRTYLDCTPKLREVDLSFMPFAPDGQNRSLSRVSRLKLTLHDTIPSAVFWGICSLPALECLDLNVPGRELALDPPGDALELPALRHLALRAYAAEIPARFGRAFRSGVLGRCHIEHGWPSGRAVRFRELAGFLGQCAGSLDSVTFSGAALRADEGAMLAAALDKVPTVVFNNGSLDAHCIAAFHGGFSGLERVTICNTALVDDAIETFINFVRQRCPVGPAPEGQLQKRLSFVSLWGTDCGFSQRDILEIRRLVDGKYHSVRW
ncbi:hypothetical protein AURDEDRAFT_188716 [Auricularia subglabra TFB-10046 SS5]|uniref:F-box domain-containing protein n=1 Tax=Auricularia subglabra (strain TFB-10046 / SS5) TaxID=717982 RepID=J0WRW4_AURST|nr:hypothetical protein AURDEDRAFT_188716 [Auricularia subglabra TFB-10046 SS5]